jgi:hypothetical protein
MKSSITSIFIGVFILLSQNDLIHAASLNLKRPNIEEFEEVINFIKEAPPQLNTSKSLTSQIYAYNISLLVSCAKINEAIQYAQQYWNSRRDGNPRIDNQLLFRSLNQLAEHDSRFKANIFEAERAWQQDNPKLAVQYVEEAMAMSFNIDLTTDMTYGTQLAPASRVYYNMSERLRAAQKIMENYERQYSQKVFEVHEQKRREEQKKRLANSKVPVVSIRELAQAFTENKSAAERKYKGKKIRISGEIAEVDRQNLFYKQNPAITLSPVLEYLFSVIICNFDVDEIGEIVVLRNYKTVTVEGIVLGAIEVGNDAKTASVTAIQLIDCELIAYD